ncbi:MAG: DUF2062 domain-containing protein [Proteobacteria bacterium]|nr:DUF2062 domain-containing protein [Pseudomonadota bacterium]
MKLFKKHLPTREQLRAMKSLQFLGHVMFESNLWHFNRQSLSLAALVGGICCFMPIPFQMIPCVFICIWVRCNIPFAVAIVWISNPLTMPPMMFFAYRVGASLMGMPHLEMPDSFSFEWFTDQLAIVWQPLLFGSVVCGLVSGLAGFLFIQLYFRWRVARYRRRRRQRKAGEITRI